MLREKKISPCMEIYHCFKDGTCPIKDDMQELYDKLLAADVVALASPIFFYNVSAQAKAMIDRTQALWARRYVLKQDFPGGDRQGVLLAVGATQGRLLFVGTRLTAKYFFDAINVALRRGNPGQGRRRQGRHLGPTGTLNAPRTWAAAWPRARNSVPSNWTRWRFKSSSEFQ